ncbi:MAG: nicotinamide-nucleotide amidohydrolase family protein [Candidatus Krumholzibacteria bacterium]|jgi:nicotinamide-nucleotide amidase|nr:nicotinamide-nucleotide amidohydrolase family protein [Candidatus Krumholzibacteria bacterium]MDP7021679.1 nicotinamide-nucleotide amidohydrolase family protein [Candidatus Krumholzibacteria bacterium]
MDSLDLAAKLLAPIRILALGDELLRGDHPDTNSPWLASRLSALGHVPESIEQGGDRGRRFPEVLSRWQEEGGVLIVGGGLGPTEDDRSREQIAESLGRPLREDPEALAMIQALEKRRGKSFTSHTHRQALLPEGFRPLANPVGSAPALLLEKSEGFLLVLPGVPAEFRAICESLFPAIEDEASHWRLIGIGEDRLATLLEGFPDLEQLGFYPSLEGIRLRLPRDFPGREALAAMLQPWLLSMDGQSLEECLVQLLKSRGETLGLAESCTGGMAGAHITRVQGSSEVFLGGVESYSNHAKECLLGVPGDILEEEGAVSEAAARFMASGLRERLSCDWAISITGIAGPGGGSRKKPIGTVHFALEGPGTSLHLQRLFSREREDNRRLAVQTALTLLWKTLREDNSLSP